MALLGSGFVRGKENFGESACIVLPRQSCVMVVVIQLVMVGFTFGALLSIILVDNDKIRDHLVWVILIVISLGL